MKRIRIGCLITPYFDEEIDKDELIVIDVQKRPWLDNVPSEYTIHYEKKTWVSYDISILLYLRKFYGKQYDIVPIIGNNKNIYKEVQSCNIVFLLIFDKLEAYHVLSKQEYQRIENVFSKDNIYPPAAFQMLINYKNEYYDFLRKKHVDVLPMLVVKSTNIEDDMEEVEEQISKLPKGDEGKIIGKPIFGQESIDFRIFAKEDRTYKIRKYLERIASLYEGCIFQPYIKSLQNNGEWRVFFIGMQYVYMIRTIEIPTIKITFVDTTKDEKSREVLQFAKRVFNTLPRLELFGRPVDRLITRIDIGCCQQGRVGYFVSELEFVPSMFFDVLEVQELQMDKKLSEQIIHIVRQIDFHRYNVNLVKMQNRERMVIVLVLVIILVLIMVFRSWKK